MEEVASVLGMPPVAVYEVATFYSMYNLEADRQAQGVHLHRTCRARCSGARGRGRAPEEASCGVGLQRDHAPTARFTLKEGECFGACGDAPVMLVNNKTHVSAS